MPSALSSEFLLDPELTFINHGSFGACPRVVLAAQTALRERLERDQFTF
jgi:isopenicillin-N epimerase